MGRAGTFARRTFLVASASVVGGALFGYWKYRQTPVNPLNATLDGEASAITPYVRIDQAGVTVIVPRAEMGQGVRTTLAALVAEELDVPLADIQIEHGPASAAYYNAAMLSEGVPFAPTDEGLLANSARSFMQVPAKFLGLQLTGGSSSVPDAYEKHRLAGAVARESLKQAAADAWGVAVAEVSTQAGSVLHADGRRLAYPELASAAASLELSEEPQLKAPKDWSVLGKSLPREDMLPKCTGQSVYSIDVRLPGMRYASVLSNPHLGSDMKGFDAAAALTKTGVERVVPLRNGVAIVATNTWYAMQALKSVDCEWYPSSYPQTTEAMFDDVVTAFSDDARDSRMRDDGDVDAQLGSGDVIEAEYRVPYLAHATLEPMNATVLYLPEGAEPASVQVWVGTQFPTQAVQTVAAITEVDPARVNLHTTQMGGGFGRRAEMDYIEQAAEIAFAVPGTPVKLTWSREQDTRHDTYRPLAIGRLRAAIKPSGLPVMDLSLAAPSVMSSQLSRIGRSIPGPDSSIVQGAWEQPYGFEHYRVTGYRAKEMLPVGFWRSVGASQNGFFHESAIDELAHAAGVDPLEFRLAHMNDEPSQRVLNAVAEMSDWGGELPEGHARGVAFVHSFGVPTAEVIEVRVASNGVKLVHAWAAVDVGVALDPDNIKAQVMGGLNFGLSAAIHGEITVKEGRVEQSNFHDFPSLRMREAPPVDVRVLEGGKHIRGIGEPGTPPAAPALANALFAATGQRIRELPLSKAVRFA